MGPLSDSMPSFDIACECVNIREMLNAERCKQQIQDGCVLRTCDADQTLRIVVVKKSAIASIKCGAFDDKMCFLYGLIAARR